MPDIPKIPATLEISSVSAIQPSDRLPATQVIEAKVSQIVNDELVRLTSSFGTFDLRASDPALQPGTNVSVVLSDSGAVTLTVVSPRNAATPQVAPPPETVPPQFQPAVITSLSTGPPRAAPPPNIYSSTGQTVLPTQPVAANEPVAPALPTPPVTTPSSITTTSSATLTPAQPQTAAAALSSALSQDIVKQQSLVPLFANLNTVAKLAKPIPEPLRVAIVEAIAAVAPLSQNATSGVLQQAIKDSGVFYENKLAQFAGNPSADAESFPALKSDLKNVLLQLETALNEAGARPAVTTRPAAIEDHLPPPRSGEAPLLQSSREPLLNASSVVPDIISTLSHQTDAALSRLRVLQIASMPAQTDSIDPLQRPSQALHVDLPLMINGQANVIPLQIERDAEKRNAEAQERRWRVRFALDLSELGPVHAMLALGGGMVNVTLWAERPETHQLFRSMTRELQQAMQEDALEVSDIDMRNGSPHQALPPAGSNLDTQT